MIWRLLAKAPSPTMFPNYFQGLLDGLVASRDTVTIVQAGANDGSTSDPIAPLADRAPNKVRLIAVEPDPTAFNRLSQRYANNPNVVCVKAGLGKAGRLPFFRLAEKHWDKYQAVAKQDPTFFTAMERDHVARSIAERMSIDESRASQMVEEFYCEVFPLRTLLERHGWGTPDVFQIGINDFDGALLEDTLTDGITPAVVEYSVKRVKPAVQSRISNMLEGRGYHVASWRKNGVCASR